MPRRRRKASIQCPNCGTAMLEGDHYCRHCGQENHDLRVPFRHFAYEFVESLTHFDTRLWSTLKLIFTKPGQLTKDYVEGKRARYVRPAQFYVFVSIIFFAMVSWNLDHALGEAEAALPDRAGDGPHAGLDGLVPDSLLMPLRVKPIDLERIVLPIRAPGYRRVAARLRTASPDVLDSLVDRVHGDTVAGVREPLRAALAALPDTDRPDIPYTAVVSGRTFTFHDEHEEQALRRRLPYLSDGEVDSLLSVTGGRPNWLLRRIFRAQIGTDTPIGKRQLIHTAVKAISFSMFLLMPLTAVLLLWIFFSRRYYWEHLIFAIHIHTIYFLFFILFMLADILWPGGLMDGMLLVLFLACAVYLVRSLRRVYGRSWASTIARLLLMAGPYFLALFLLTLGGLVLGFFSL